MQNPYINPYQSIYQNPIDSNGQSFVTQTGYQQDANPQQYSTQFNQVNASQDTMQTTAQSDQLVIPTRIVDAPNNIRVQDVPMNNQLSLFMLKDYSCIYAKTWNSEGTISTHRYVLEKDPEDIQETDNNNNVYALLEEMNQRLDRIEKGVSPQKKTNRPVRPETSELEKNDER